MDQYLNKAFLIICYLYFATVWGFSLTDDYRVFILFFILLLSFVIFIFDGKIISVGIPNKVF